MSYILIAAIGLLGGFVSGLLGVGGGTIFVPLMIFVLGFNAHLAIGTSLLIVIPTALMGVLVHGINQQVDVKSAIFIIIFALIGAWFGSWISVKLDVALLRKIFAIFLILVAVKLLLQR